MIIFRRSSKSFKLKNIEQNVRTLKNINQQIPKIIAPTIAPDLTTLEKKLNNAENSIFYKVHLKFNRIIFEDNLQFFNRIRSPNMVESITLKNCCVKNIHFSDIVKFPNLNSISLENCCGNIFKMFKTQTSIIKITIKSFKNYWNGFPHNKFLELAETLPNFEHLILIGEGTGSFLDIKTLPLKLKILEVESITHHWYVGLKSPRTNFLNSQKEYLKELIIQQFPFDFDGGDVLKFILKNMNLQKFYCGNLALIVNGHNQKINEISVNELQVQSMMEMLRQFSSKLLKNFQYF